MKRQKKKSEIREKFLGPDVFKSGSLKKTTFGEEGLEKKQKKKRSLFNCQFVYHWVYCGEQGKWIKVKQFGFLALQENHQWKIQRWRPKTWMLHKQSMLTKNKQTESGLTDWSLQQFENFESLLHFPKK